MEIPGGWGGPPTTLWNGNSRGVGGFKLKNHPWGGMDIFWNHTIIKKISVLLVVDFLVCTYAIQMKAYHFVWILS